MAFDIEIITTNEGFASLKPVWEDLCSRQREANLFLEFG